MAFILGFVLGVVLDWRKVWVWITSLLSDDVPVPRPRPTLRIVPGTVREQTPRSG